MVSDGATWPADPLGQSLETLRRESPECFLTHQGWSLGDDENRLSRDGADTVVAHLPGWRAGKGGESLRRRFALEAAPEAVALLAAVQAFAGGDRWTPEWQCELGNRHLDLAVRGAGGEGLPPWLAFLAQRLDSLASPAPEPRPADREAPAALSEEIQPPWRLSRDRSAVLGRYAFPTPRQTLAFACLASALAVLQSEAVRLTLEVHRNEVRLRLSRPAGDGVDPTVLLASHDLSAQARTCGAHPLENQAPEPSP